MGPRNTKSLQDSPGGTAELGWGVMGRGRDFHASSLPLGQDREKESA